MGGQSPGEKAACVLGWQERHSAGLMQGQSKKAKVQKRAAYKGAQTNVGPRQR
ncbi:hypothetical protein SBDP1_780021 [Syntrophobacter sp. SbD1]|nr:hypothetical protein SBDP1_780021 [Syntrophobacter sp. SbD1]